MVERLCRWSLRKGRQEDGLWRCPAPQRGGELRRRGHHHVEYQGLFFSYAASYPYAYSLLAAASEIKNLLTTFWNSETRSVHLI